MNDVVKIVNCIKSSALRSRIFKLCESMQSEFKCLLYHTEVRWLSKGKVLSRFITLKEEIQTFFDSQQTKFKVLAKDIWWLEVTLLNDIFDKLKKLNVIIQGSCENMITVSCKLKAFQENLHFCTMKAVNKQLDCFPCLDSFEGKSKIMSDIIATLENLSTAFNRYFPSLGTSKTFWIISPFVEILITNLSGVELENLIDLRNKIVLRIIFFDKKLSEFWIGVYEKYSQ